jgi:uncharacterized protein YhhL (DUF1145 family)
MLIIPLIMEFLIHETQILILQGTLMRIGPAMLMTAKVLREDVTILVQT